MTIKNSLISVAASALLISAMTGCSSSDSTPASSSEVTSVTGEDGYVLNATAVAYVQQDNNTTVAVPMTTTNFITNISTGATTQVGSPIYTIPDANASKVRHVTLSFKAGVATPTTNTRSTFFDDNGNGVWDANDTVPATTWTLTAPYGVSVVSPINDIIFGQLTSTFPTVFANAGTADLNASTKTSIDENLSAMATALGITKAALKAPALSTVSTAESAKLASMNAMLGNLALTGVTAANKKVFMDTLVAATPATTFAGTFTNLAAAATAAGSTATATICTNFATAIGQATSEADFITSIASMNLDETRTNNGSPVALSASTTALTNIYDDMNITNTLVSALDASNGAKIPFTAAAMDAVVIRLASTTASEGNSTGNMDLYVDLKGPALRVNDANSSSAQLTIKVSGVELNATDAGSYIQTNTDTRVAYEAYTYNATSSAAEIVAVNDLNLTSFGATGAPLSIINSATANQATLLINTLVAAVEANITNAAGFAWNDTNNWMQDGVNANQNVQSLKIALNDNNLLEKRNANEDSVYWPAGVLPIAGPASLTGSGKVILNQTIDQRNGVALGVNTTPRVGVLAVTAGNLASGGSAQATGWVNTGVNTVAVGGYTGTAAAGVATNAMYVVNTDGTADINITGFQTPLADAQSGIEDNSSITFSMLTTAMDGNASQALLLETNTSFNSMLADGGTNGAFASAVAANAAGGYLLAIDGDAAATSRHPIATYKMVITDEFSAASSAENNITFVINRAPTVGTRENNVTTVDSNTSVYLDNTGATGADINVTSTTYADVDLDNAQLNITTIQYSLDSGANWITTGGAASVTAYAINAAGVDAGGNITIAAFNGSTANTELNLTGLTSSYYPDGLNAEEMNVTIGVPRQVQAGATGTATTSNDWNISGYRAVSGANTIDSNASIGSTIHIRVGYSTTDVFGAIVTSDQNVTFIVTDTGN